MDSGGEARFLTQWCMGESLIDAVFRGVNGTGCELGSRLVPHALSLHCICNYNMLGWFPVL